MRTSSVKSPMANSPTSTAKGRRPAALVLAAAMSALIAVPGVMAASSEHAIMVLVNDEPITAYEVKQRGKLLALNANIGSYIKERAKKRWERLVKNPKINDEFRAYATKRNPKSREELKKIQQQFIRQKQKAMMKALEREARANAARGTQKKAIKELVEERLKLQAAKRNNVVASDEQVGKIIAGIAQRNKMTADQFGQHMAKMGVDIETMKQRFKALISWNSVVRRRFGFQIQGSERDIERFVDPAMAGGGGSGGNVVLTVQRVTLPVPDGLNQTAVAARLAEADQMRSRFSGCKSTKKLAASVGAKFEDLGKRAQSSIPEPTRTLLLNAETGEMIPPNVGPDGVELWTLCAKTAADAGKDGPAVADASKGSSAKEERRRKELDILARKHLKDLRQDATIDCRAGAKTGLCQAL